jgi:two-component system nitrate/nitrite response regulator NarL
MQKAILFTDQCLLVEGVEALLGRSPWITLSAVCSDTAVLFQETVRVEPDVVLLDLDADVTWTFVMDFIARSRRVRVVLLTRKAAPELMIHAREIGAAGLLDTTVTPRMLLDLLSRVKEQSLFECPLAASLPPTTSIRLSPRESQLVSMLAQGHTNKEIATALGISQGTVKVYMSKLFQKVGAKDRLELALFGLRNSGTPSSGHCIPDLRSLVLTRTAGVRAQATTAGRP